MALNLPATKLLEDDEAFIEKANTFKVSYPRETQIWYNNATVHKVHISRIKTYDIEKTFIWYKYIGDNSIFAKIFWC